MDPAWLAFCMFPLILIGVPVLLYLIERYNYRQRLRRWNDYQKWLRDWHKITTDRYLQASTNLRMIMITHVFENGNVDQKRLMRELAIMHGTQEERSLANAEHQSDQLRQQAEQTRLVGRAVAWGNFFDTFHD